MVLLPAGSDAAVWDSRALPGTQRPHQAAVCEDTPPASQHSKSSLRVLPGLWGLPNAAIAFQTEVDGDPASLLTKASEKLCLARKTAAKLSFPKQECTCW